jgi:serine/threonine protein kinase
VPSFISFINLTVWTKYQGILAQGQEIAVKRLSKTSRQGVTEFMNEVGLVAKLQHRNLVSVLGGCTYGNERILVYEFMPNGSLNHFIFGKTTNPKLGKSQLTYHLLCAFSSFR